jgi:sulfur-oxidizing protein SoxX
MNHKYSLLFGVSLLVAGCAGVQSNNVTAAGESGDLLQQYIKASFLPGDNQDLSRLQEDETIQTCNQYPRGNLPTEVALAIMEREKKTIQYPADGKLMGDWKEGEKYFKMGFAYRIGKIEPDKPDKDRGGNCYACHGGDPKEVAYGTIGPTLTGYGKLRGSGEEIAKLTYDKIYNAQSAVACSQMPRLGYKGILTPEKIAHITAYLLAPESPVNK